LEHDEI